MKSPALRTFPRVCRLTAALSLLLAGGAAAAADELPVFVTAKYGDKAQLQKIASRFQHLIVDREAKTVRVEAMPADVDALRRAGFEVEIDGPATARLQRLQTALQRAGGVGIRSIPGFTCYRTVEETYATMDELAQTRPGLAEVLDIGPSWEKSQDPGAGYTMKVLKLTNQATDATLPDKPDMVLFGSIHAREYTPAETVTRFGEWLANGYGTDDEATWLLDNFRFHLVLQANPDGRKRAEVGDYWRKNTDDTNGICGGTDYGIDLNRNFPFHWGPGGSSGDPCAETYRGPKRASEPETQNLVAYVAGAPDANGVYGGGVFPDRRGDAIHLPAPDDYRGIFFDIHSYARLVLWSWGDTPTDAPNGPALQTLGRRLAWFNGYRPQQSDELYATTGTTDDTMYGLLGVPSYTIELGVAFFESCSTFENTTLPDNLAALRYAARSLHAPYKYPSGPDTVTVTTSASSVPAGTPVTVNATVSDARFNQSNGSEPVQNIASANAWLDAPPWQAGATPIALSAVDGNFNASSEAVTGSIPTAGLDPGVHTIYVQGTDAAGKPGTPNAVRFSVGDGTWFENTADYAIGDRSTIRSPIRVRGVPGNAPSDLQIAVTIRHTRRGDLRVDLVAPDGSAYTLHNRGGGDADDLVRTYTRNVSSEVANGIWKLRGNDNANQNTGYIDKWSLQF